MLGTFALGFRFAYSGSLNMTSNALAIIFGLIFVNAYLPLLTGGGPLINKDN
jgi:hypothetical protein